MEGGGYIKVWRSLIGHPIMKHSGLCHLWVYCLLRAEWKERDRLVLNTTQSMQVERGSFLTTRSKLHAGLYPKDRDEVEHGPAPSPSTVWRWLMSLQTMECLIVQTMNKLGTIVTICNYDLYQDRYAEPWTDDEPIVHNSHLDEEGKNKRKAPKPQPPKFDPLSSVIPSPIDTPRFHAAWAEWLNYRADRRLSTRETTVRKQLSDFARWGEEKAIEAINASIRNGWHGVFEPRGAVGGNTKCQKNDANLFANLERFAERGENDRPQ